MDSCPVADHQDLSCRGHVSLVSLHKSSRIQSWPASQLHSQDHQPWWSFDHFVFSSYPLVHLIASEPKKDEEWKLWKALFHCFTPLHNASDNSYLLTSTAKQVLGNCERLVFASFVENFNFDSFNPNFLFTFILWFLLSTCILYLCTVILCC